MTLQLAGRGCFNEGRGFVCRADYFLKASIYPMKTAILFLLLALTILAAGCAKQPNSGSGSSTPNYAATETPQTDGSIITASEENGIKSEVRFFPEGDIAQVSRVSRPDGRRYATVKFRDGRSTDLQEAADIERVMEASSAELAAAAAKHLPASETPVPAPAVGANKK